MYRRRAFRALLGLILLTGAGSLYAQSTNAPPLIQYAAPVPGSYAWGAASTFIEEMLESTNSASGSKIEFQLQVTDASYSASKLMYMTIDLSDIHCSDGSSTTCVPPTVFMLPSDAQKYTYWPSQTHGQLSAPLGYINTVLGIPLSKGLSGVEFFVGSTNVSWLQSAVITVVVHDCGTLTKNCAPPNFPFPSDDQAATARMHISFYQGTPDEIFLDGFEQR